MVPVLDNNKQPLMPCSEKRARRLMEKGEAKACWQAGIFCIRLLKEPSNRGRQPIALGIDPGSKREGYTVLTKKHVVLNITTNTPSWVKDHIETRRILRRKRRSRKAPYRQARANRASLRNANRLPPSTKARWQAKLRIIKLLQRILPITHVNVEDIKAVSKKGKVKWNISFSPLETGKNWFYLEIEKLGLQLMKTEGSNTKKHRDNRCFKKSKDKLAYVWEAHNCDSHSLAEIVLKVQVRPFIGIHKIQFLKYHRRQLHVANFIKGGIRKQYGGTVSIGLQRGSTVIYKGELVYVGGYSKMGISLHDIETGKRISRTGKIIQIQTLYARKYTTTFNKRGAISSSRSCRCK
jgi:hypothetical protein